MRCPKCNHEQSSDFECQACGIIFEKYYKLRTEKENLDRTLDDVSSSDKPSGRKNFALYGIFAVGFAVVCLLLYFVFGLSQETQTETVKKSYTEPVENTYTEPVTQQTLTGIAKQLYEANPPKNDIEKARNATVFIETPWGIGSGFFIDNDCNIISNKHVIEFDKEQLKKFSYMVERLETLIKIKEKEIEKAEEMSGKLSYDVNTKFDMAARIEQGKAVLRNMKANYEKLKSKLDEVQYGIDYIEYKIILVDGSEYTLNRAELSEEHDLALLRINESNCPHLEIAESENLQIGERVYTIGNPLGLSHTVTSGIFSGHREYLGKIYIQTDAPINPGNSGGPLININGKVLGVNTMIVKDTEGIGFAIPIKTIIEEFNIKNN